MPRGIREPVAVEGVTYPSKSAASIALYALGKPAKVIANLIGSTPAAVEVVVKKAKRDAAKVGAPDPAPGIWTPEKAAKVRRLFGHTMIEIAAAVQVSPAELLKYVLHGVIPPSQTVQAVDDIQWNEAPVAALPAPAEQPDFVDVEPVAPDREDDEAELARLEAAESNVQRVQSAPAVVKEPAPAPVRFPDPAPAPRQVATAAGTRALIPTDGLFPAGCEVRLTDGRGKYLHESLEGMTDKPKHAWQGGRALFDTVKARMPKVVKKLQMEVVL